MWSINLLTKNDIDFAIQLTDTVDWEYKIQDFQFMIDLEPKGCFVLSSNSKKIGLVTTTTFGQIGWLGNLIIQKEYQNKGFGSTLLKHALTYLKNMNVTTVGIYSYLDKINFYKKFGFQSDEKFVLFKRKGLSRAIGTKILEPVEDNTFKQLVLFDAQYFGESRKKMLKKIRIIPSNAFYTIKGKAKIIGYVCIKTDGQNAEIGPLICKKEESKTAVNLLKRTLNFLKGIEVSITIPIHETFIRTYLIENGFKEKIRAERMFLGKKTIKKCIYIAESLERG